MADLDVCDRCGAETCKKREPGQPLWCWECATIISDARKRGLAYSLTIPPKKGKN